MAGNEQSSSANEQSFSANEDSLVLLEKLGKHKKSGGCLYINELFDVDQVVLETLIEKSFKYMKKTNAGFGR